jgi:hypothetical protein
MQAKIDPTRSDYLKQDMDGIMRPRLWLMQDEIAALPSDTTVWRNVGGDVVWGGVFSTKADAEYVAHCNKRDTGGGMSFGKPIAITAGELQN